jgi:hypothetical protein
VRFAPLVPCADDCGTLIEPARVWCLECRPEKTVARQRKPAPESQEENGRDPDLDGVAAALERRLSGGRS